MFSRKNEFPIFPNFNQEQHDKLEIFSIEKETSHNVARPFLWSRIQQFYFYFAPIELFTVYLHK